jgi:DNA-binding transcriptional LysR family regulator
MDLEDLRIFVKVAELQSFTQAAAHLGMTKARASAHVRALEELLSTRLFSRTTRAVSPTADGEQLLPRARRLLAEADELSSQFASPRLLRGRVRLDLPERWARDTILPRIGELVSRHPQLELLVSTTDRRVEVEREGFDCVLRVGALVDSSLTVRKLGALSMANAASPAYLKKHGLPKTPAELGRHLVIHYSPKLGSEQPSFDWLEGGRTRSVPMKAQLAVNSSDAYEAACLAGLGIVQAPRRGLLPRFNNGQLVEVLPGFTEAPMPVSLVHPHGRSVPARVRVVLDWLAEVVGPAVV